MRSLFVCLNLEIAERGDVLRLIRSEHWLSKREKSKQRDNRTNHYYGFHPFIVYVRMSNANNLNQVLPRTN
jgi:hypothetical protein